ncbi:MAG: PIN domain-containing protein [Anaerolineae bacterium]|nr:PIN domain-containing protein [Anaerolineae bacterium]
MKILVDTSVWSLALRRKTPPDNPFVHELSELIKERRVQMMGPIRQEILSGIKEETQFKALQKHLTAFPDLELTTADYERAAEFFNTNRRKGIQGSNTDFLICAVAERYDMAILTTDDDFKLFQQHIPITLHQPRFEDDDEPQQSTETAA